MRRGRSGDLWLGSDLDVSGHIVALQDNLAIEQVKGCDVALDYNVDLGRWGNLRVNNVLAYVESWDQQELAGRGRGSLRRLLGRDLRLPAPGPEEQPAPDLDNALAGERQRQVGAISAGSSP